MSIIHAPAEPTHNVGAARFTSLATPSRGSTETAVDSSGGDAVLRLLCCLPVGGQARLDGTTFTPPWAE